MIFSVLKTKICPIIIITRICFEIPPSPQTNMNNWRTTSAKSINVDIIRKVIEYSLKNVFWEGNLYSHRFRDIAVRRKVGIMMRTEGCRERKY